MRVIKKRAVQYRKIPRISPSKYKAPKRVTQKALSYIVPPNISLWGLVLGNGPQFQNKTEQKLYSNR